SPHGTLHTGSYSPRTVPDSPDRHSSSSAADTSAQPRQPPLHARPVHTPRAHVPPLCHESAAASDLDPAARGSASDTSPPPPPDATPPPPTPPPAAAAAAPTGSLPTPAHTSAPPAHRPTTPSSRSPPAFEWPHA